MLAATKKIFRVNQPGSYESVGQRRLVSAERISDRPRKRSHTLGTESHVVVIFLQRDHAAPTQGNRTQIREVDPHGNAKQVALLGMQRLTVADDAEFGRGPADVQGQNSFETVELRQIRGAVNS